MFQYYCIVVTHSTLAFFHKVEQCIDMCDMGQQHIDDCCAAYGYHQNGFCSRLLGKQVKCEIKDWSYAGVAKVSWSKFVVIVEVFIYLSTKIDYRIEKYNKRKLIWYFNSFEIPTADYNRANRRFNDNISCNS